MRWFLVLIIIHAVLITAGCVITAPFLIVNQSSGPVRVKYVRAPGSFDLQWPRVEDIDSDGYQNPDLQHTLPKEQIVLSHEPDGIEFELGPNQVASIASLDVYYLDKDPYKELGLQSLSIRGANGSIEYNGKQVFDRFTPEGRNWFASSPKRFLIIYK